MQRSQLVIWCRILLSTLASHFTNMDYVLILAWISNHKTGNVCDGITYPLSLQRWSLGMDM